MEENKKIYLDYQATCPLDERVLSKMLEHLAGPAANPHSSEHSFGWQAARAVLGAQETVASLIGADADEIIFTSGATEANNLALRGRDYSARTKLIVSAIDHKCVLETARQLSFERGVEVVPLDVDENGFVELDKLQAHVDERTAVVSVIGVNNEIGTVQPLMRISEMVRAAGAKLHLDLAQAPSAIDLSKVADIADTISLSAHKMYGPMGIGCLYISRSEQRHIRPQMLGGGQQSGLRSGTVPVALAIGMAKAAEIIMSSPEEREELRRLTCKFWQVLQELPYKITLNGPTLDLRHPGNLNVSFVGFDGRSIIGALQPKVAASSGSACSSGIEEPSYVLRSIGQTDEEATSAVRFGIGRQTNSDDIAVAVSHIGAALKKLEGLA